MDMDNLVERHIMNKDLQWLQYSDRFERPPYDVEDEVSRSSENIIIELNVDDDPEIEFPVIELDLNQFFEYDDKAMFDSSVEEIIGQKANDGEGNRDIKVGVELGFKIYPGRY